MMLKSKKLDLDGVIAIGSVIRGETAHFDYVCSAAAQGIKDVNLKSNDFIEKFINIISCF